MTITNAGNKYKFAAIMARRSNKKTCMIQPMLKSGKLGKAFETEIYGSETPEDVVRRFKENNNKEFRLAE